MKVSENIQRNETYIRQACRNCDDVILRSMKLGKNPGKNCLLVYVEAAAGNELLEQSLIGRFLNRLYDMEPKELENFVAENGAGLSGTGTFETMEDAMACMLSGNAVFFLDGYGKAVKIASKGYPGMGVLKAESEKTLRGSKEGFSESVKQNTALIRKRIRSTGLKVEEITLGARSDTVAALVYMEELIYPDLLDKIKRRLQAWEIDGVLDTGMLEQLAEEDWLSPFPQFESTERPDRAAMEALNGRIILLCDNSPMGVILPTTFNSFLKSTEDRYNRFEIVCFQRLIRYGAVLATLLFSGIYLAVINFHTQILPTNLILSFAEARKGVPFPSLVEILLMELAFELIREAGVRMPGPLGGTIGIVGGLIIGDAAVSANLVSPMTVVVVAVSALSSLAIPNEEFSTAFRLLKYGFILLGGLAGCFGLVLGIFLLAGHLAGLESFRIPYLMPLVGKGLEGFHDEKDNIFRGPFHLLKSRPVYARRSQRIRMKKKEGA